eukprot:SAG31_NODE_2907_length_4924_cov_1.619482_1_plen_244_part_00
MQCSWPLGSWRPGCSGPGCVGHSWCTAPKPWRIGCFCNPRQPGSSGRRAHPLQANRSINARSVTVSSSHNWPPLCHKLAHQLRSCCVALQLRAGMGPPPPIHWGGGGATNLSPFPNAHPDEPPHPDPLLCLLSPALPTHLQCNPQGQGARRGWGRWGGGDREAHLRPPSSVGSGVELGWSGLRDYGQGLAQAAGRARQAPGSRHQASRVQGLGRGGAADRRGPGRAGDRPASDTSRFRLPYLR